tara:strand:+ start:252 stop:638 length:387 start_codon:yes stop_codon:yes gene_type:complete
MLSDIPTNKSEIIGVMNEHPFTFTFVVVITATLILPWFFRILRGRPADPLKNVNSGWLGWVVVSIFVASFVSEWPSPDIELYLGCCCGILFPVAWIGSNYPQAVEMRNELGIEFVDIEAIIEAVSEEE